MHFDRFYDADSTIVLFDFAVAFPSVNHEFIFMVLERMRLPPALIKTLRIMYDHNYTQTCVLTVRSSMGSTSDPAFGKGVQHQVACLP